MALRNDRAASRSPVIHLEGRAGVLHVPQAAYRPGSRRRTALVAPTRIRSAPRARARRQNTPSTSTAACERHGVEPPRVVHASPWRVITGSRASSSEALGRDAGLEHQQPDRVRALVDRGDPPRRCSGCAGSTRSGRPRAHGIVAAGQPVRVVHMQALDARAVPATPPQAAASARSAPRSARRRCAASTRPRNASSSPIRSLSRPIHPRDSDAREPP